ncbi:hypothetical protein DAPPUDRAFT_267163 [Daphnia pulex]|uniref:MULE transposase domain-containing protein n=1 Tax=Daphnia pulex TaxID=6669 RepID=E9HW42_DAPPU|nr:hypothetical protein DAPPUDRAFT_267163 [Daphnia pulex]|eukprot:EFX64036.1 hypothetical protein DAPPUDRAFT_267163 [Daphnia pulex]
MDLIQKNVVKNEMWIRARDTRQPMRAIFDEVRDLHPNVAIAFDDKLQRSMQRARRVNQPAVPQSIDEAEESLNNNPHYNRTKDGNSPFYHGRMFPLAYAIMTEKTEALYNLVFARVIEVLRTTGDGATTIIRMVSDFEFAILNAMTTAFPGVTTEGLKRAYAERPNVQKVIKMLIALALLPADQAHAVCAQFFEPAVLPIVPAEEPPHADHSDDDEIDPPVRGRGGRARRLRVRRNGNGRAARQAPIVPGQRMPRNRRAGRGGGAVGGGPGRERDVHAALDPELILQQAMVEVGLPIDVANNQPLIEEPPLLDMDCEICGVAGNRRTQSEEIRPETTYKSCELLYQEIYFDEVADVLCVALAEH